jgi:hypothetical protein
VPHAFRSEEPASKATLVGEVWAEPPAAIAWSWASRQGLKLPSTMLKRCARGGYCVRRTEEKPRTGWGLSRGFARVLKDVVGREGFEPSTFGIGTRRSCR